MSTEADHRAQHLTKALREGQARITPQRVAIIDVLARASDHPDAAQILRRARDADGSVSMATVYRTLTTLEAAGAIERLTIEGAPARYEVIGTGHHDHIVDVETGDIVEFRSDEIERLQRSVVRERGYELVGHRLNLYVRRRRR